MYGLLWRALPGPTWVRFLISVILLGAVVVALFTWGYPWVADTFLEVDPAVG